MLRDPPRRQIQQSEKGRALGALRLARMGVMLVDSKLMVMAKKAAAAEGLDEALVCAVVEQESAWNPWAMRYEPLFFAKYVAPLYTNNKVGATEAYARGFSWGLMQVMGQTAREAGVSALHLSALCDPPWGWRWDARCCGRNWTVRAVTCTRRCWLGTAERIRTMRMK